MMNDQLVQNKKISIDPTLAQLLDISSSSSSSKICLSSQSQSSTSLSSNKDQQQEHHQQQQQEQNLRCPRCDSSNTKFCYYNNYNLTQPRHFCKTCRRYWTKGGALRNVPIGGGCRKTKTIQSLSSVSNYIVNTKSVGAGIIKIPKGTSSTTEFFAKSGLIGRLDSELQHGPTLWDSPHNSQLFSVFRDNTFIKNPNPNFSCYDKIKDDHNANIVNISHSLGFDHYSADSLWKNNANQYLYMQNQSHSNILLGDQIAMSSGIQDQCQMFKSDYNVGGVDPNSCSSSVTATATMSASSMEMLPINAGDFGHWNLALAWSDLPTTNTAFP